MDKAPLVSVILPVYNDEKYILEALNSILEQTIKDIEIIIIDDCSSDTTTRLIESINDDRIVLVKNEHNIGLTRSLNQALRLAKGKYIARMDSDDISRPKRFATQIKYLERHPQIKLISCQTKSFGSQQMISRIEKNPEKLKVAMLVRPVLAHPGFMMRCELVKQENFYYDENFSSTEDYDFASRVARKFPIGITGPVLLLYRKHEAQVSERQVSSVVEYADKIRHDLLKEIGVVFDHDEYQYYQQFANEIKSPDKSLSMKVKEIIKRIEQANQINKIYDDLILHETLFQLFFTWVIRSKSIDLMMYIWKNCDNIRERFLFIRVISKSVILKIRDNLLYKVL